MDKTPLLSEHPRPDPAVRGYYNVEIAHIYVDQDIGAEQRASAEVASAFIGQLAQDPQEITTTVLIDDYNPGAWTLTVDHYLHTLTGHGAQVDYVVYESDLVLYANCLLREMPPKTLTHHTAYLERTGKYPCSFLVAVWHLARLGSVAFDHAAPVGAGVRKPFACERIVTVLPERFRGVERTALRLLKSTPYWSGISGRLEYVFF